ncbi:MAG: MlaD family protein [Kiloniellaceae bacterium]
MYNRSINYVLIGGFVTAMLVAGIVSLALITGRTGATDRYIVVLDNVADVKFGTQVRYEGYPVGQVEAITPRPEGARMRFHVEVSIKRDWRIPADSVARIGNSSFLAAKTIDIDSGKRTEIIPVGGRIPSAPPADIFATITNAAGEISQLNRTSIQPLLATLNALAETVERGAPRITEELIAFSERLNTSLAPLEEILASDNVQAIKRVIGNVEQASRTFVAASGELAATLGKIDNLATNLDTLVAENRGNVDNSLKDIQYTLGAIAQNVDSIIHNLEGTARNMNEFSRLIRQNPGLLLDGTPRPAVSPALTSEGKAAQ